MPTSFAAAHVDPSARVLTASSAVLRAQLGALVMFVVVGMCVVSWLLSHVGVMTSEALVRVGALGRLVVLKARVRSKGRGLTGPGRSLVSMVLTSQAHRCCTPRKNRRIPTILTGRFGGWIVHVSAVDTGPRGSESGVLGGRARRRRGVGPPPQLPPTLRRLPHPAPATWVPSHVTNVMTPNIELYPAPARRPAGHGSTPTPPAPSRLRPAPTPSRPESAYSTRVGIY